MTSPQRDAPIGAAGSGSHLRESLLKARIAKLPHLPAVAPFGYQAQAEQGEEEVEQEERDTLGNLSMHPPTSKGSQQKNRRRNAAEDEFAPLSAEDCFEEALEVDLENTQSDVHRHNEIDSDVPSSSRSSRSTDNAFRVYYTPAKLLRAKSKSFGSALDQTAIDGAGISLGKVFHKASELDTDEGSEDDGSDLDDAKSTIFLLHHGAGYSALSFALVAKSITQQTKGKAGVLAYDCRGHGKTRHGNADESRALSLSNLTQDGLAILAKLFPSGTKQPNLILVGHSMGGAVVVSMAHALSSLARTGHACPHVAGVAVLDVVEGTAMEALPAMKLIVSQLPRGFSSVSEAIRWHVESGTIVNAQSARRSVPSLLQRQDHEEGRERQVKREDESGREAAEEPMEELVETSVEEVPVVDKDTKFPYVWRHDLLSTEPYWPGWFQGLSQSFLQVKCARLLLLAGTDRLDKELMIGQMQGKYQLVVFPEVGHSLQEDAPQKTAQTLIEFWQRNESVNVKAVKGLRKVGQA